MSADAPGSRPPGSGPLPPSEGEFGVVALSPKECWDLLRARGLGRFIVVDSGGSPDIFPMNYLVHENRLYVRSAPGSKVQSILVHPAVAFEVDGETTRHHWDVVVHGTARVLESDDEIEAAGVRGLVSWSPTPKLLFIELTPDTLTGRQFTKGPYENPRPPVRRNGSGGAGPAGSEGT